HWENTIIVFRGDGHFSSPEVFDYIATQENMYSITGLTSNNKLHIKHFTSRSGEI
ncbi:MAG: transposase, partial [Candidatus Marinimicrobia bacterium]|nr:transposase [Candidatus Neomarinimicrobiota bacterium]